MNGTSYLMNVHVIDCVTSEPSEPATVIIRGDSIAYVGEQSRTSLPGPDDVVVDCESTFLMPGLWDAHAHLGLALPQDDPRYRPPFESAPARAIRAGRNAIQALQKGITSIRVVGEADYVDVAWKRAFDSGTWDGPRLIVCGAALACTGGHATHTGLAIGVDGAKGFTQAARQQFYMGADQIKLMVTGGIGSSPTESADTVELSREEICAAVGVAHARGSIVGAHVGGAAGAKLCVTCGVDVIEHGYILDDEAIEMMVRSGTYLVPTLSVTQLGAEEYRAAGWAEYAIRNSERIAPLHGESFRRALEAGVKIASGEDTDSIGRNAAREVELLTRLGVESFQAIRAATVVPAQMCHLDHRVGTVEVGKIADLIATVSSPLTDVRQLQSPVFVMKGGRIISLADPVHLNRGMPAPQRIGVGPK